mmetsp:Transcript_852/g.1947  ORF Transcript_852/g.1947 Transcript_852/m.1947 type:complete len:746 (-) Transcript_852:88-2325(-)
MAALVAPDAALAAPEVSETSNAVSAIVEKASKPSKTILSVKSHSLVWHQNASSKEDGIACTFCGASGLESLAKQLSRVADFKGLESTAKVFDETASRHSEDLQGLLSSNVVTCSLGCGGLYCSPECCERDFEEGGHRFLCLGHAHSEDHELYQARLLAYASGYCDEFGLAQRLLGRLIAELENQCTDLLDLITQRGEPWECFEESAEDVQSTVEEMWELYCGAIPVIAELDKLDAEVWSKLVGFAVQNRLEVEQLETPLLRFAEYLKNMVPAAQERLGRIFVNALQARNMHIDDQNDLSEEEEGEEDGEEDLGEYSAGGDDDENEESEGGADAGKLPLTLARFIAEPKIYLPSLSGMVIPLFNSSDKYRHSCAPTMEIRWRSSGIEGVQAHMEKHWIVGGEESYCFIDRSLSLEDRQEELAERNIFCQCARCVLESSDGVNNESISTLTLKLILEQLQADDLFTEALQVADIILERDSLDVEVLYTKSRLLSWTDRWTAAHHLRMETLALVESSNRVWTDKEQDIIHKIRRTARVHEGFACSGLAPLPESSIDDQFESVDTLDFAGATESTGHIWYSKPDHPVMDRETCKRIIDEAEKYAQEMGGWSSTRHYAVPTTDIEVSELPFVKEAFANALRERIYPALATQFNVDPNKIRPVDAFLVKYDASKQNHLPVHSDESQFSFTLALNDPSEYIGGGTWFPGLGESLNAHAGGMVSFPGPVAHGGNAITSGKRYIIAAFLYALEE